MKKKLHVIYIPGIGDSNPNGQRRAVGWWRLWGVEPELFQMNWADKAPWQTKFDRLLARIDELAAQGKVIALVGASAGGGAVINAYAARQDKISGVVLISGKIFRPEAIGNYYRKNDPAFVESASEVPASLDSLNVAARRRILSRYAIFDEVVHTKDSHIEGAHNQTVLSAGHFLTIAQQLTIGAPGILRFLKRQIA